MSEKSSVIDSSKEKFMNEVSETAHERSRKAVASVLQAMQVPGRGVAIATAMAVSEATASRIKNEQMEAVVLYLYHAGFKVVPQDYRCIPEVTARAWFESHRREVRHMEESGNLWTEE